MFKDNTHTDWHERKRESRRRHLRASRPERESRECAWCGRTYYPQPSALKGRDCYCSSTCAERARHKKASEKAEK